MYDDLTIGQMYAFDFFTNVKNWMINKAVAPIEYKWNNLEDFTSVINYVKDGDNCASIEDHFKELITLPEDYLKNVSEKEAADLLGDGWTIPVIVHILKNMEF